MTVTSAPFARLNVEKLEDRTNPSTFADGTGQFGGWATDVGNSTGSVVPLAMTTDAAGDVVVVGVFTSTVDFDPSSLVFQMTSTNNNDYFGAKYTRDGVFLGAKRFAVEGTANINDLAVGADGSIFLVGAYQNTQQTTSGGLGISVSPKVDFDPSAPGGELPDPATDASDTFVTKLTADGDFVWAETFRAGSFTGGTTNPSVAVTADGRLFVAGELQGSADFDSSAWRSFLTLTRSNITCYVCELAATDGSFARVTSPSGLLTIGDFQVNDLAVATDGSAFVGGTTNILSRGGTEATVLKFGTAGGVEWTRRLQSAKDDSVRALATDAAGNVYVGGQVGGPATGWATLAQSSTKGTAFVSKLAADGSHVWSHEWGGDGTSVILTGDTTTALAVRGTSVYAAGALASSSVRINPDPAAPPLTRRGPFQDAFLGQWTTDGAFVADGQAGGATAIAAPTGLAVDGFGRAYVAGTFNGTADFDPTAAGTKNLSSESVSSTFDMFLGKFRLTPRVDLYATSPGPGASPRVKVFNPDGTLRYDFFAYEEFFTGGVSVATGDLTGDGIDEIITGAMASGGPRVRVFDGASAGAVPNQIAGPLGSFFAFESFFPGGVSVGVGDVNGDGVIDLVTAAGPSGGPRVRVFDGRSASGGEPVQVAGPLGSFFAFESFFAGGVSLAVGDVTGDGRTDLVTSAGPSGGPRVRVFDARSTGAEPSQVPGTLGSFFALPQSFTGGITVAIGEITGDGVGDFIVGQASQGSAVRVLDSTKIKNDAAPALLDFEALDNSPRGARVAAADLDDDGQVEILVGEGPNGQPRLRAFKANGIRLTALAELPYDATLGTGIFVG